MSAKERLEEEIGVSSEEEAIREYIGIANIIGITYSLIADHISEFIQLKHGPAIDLGTGLGSLAIEIAKRYPYLKVIGLDISESILKQAKKYADEQNISNIAFKVCDVHSLDFPDNSAELIVSQGSMHHWRDVKRALKEIYRVLMPAGLAFISDLKADAPAEVVGEVVGLLNKAQAKGFMNSINASYLPKEVEGMLNDLGIIDYSVCEQKFSRRVIIKNLDKIRKSANRFDRYNKLHLNILIKK